MTAGVARQAARPTGTAEPAGGFLRARRRLLLALLAALGGWRLVDAAIVQARSLAEIGFARRVELATLDVSERTRRTLGADTDLLEALGSAVPPHASVTLSLRQRDLARPELASLVLLAERLKVLLYPLEVAPLPGPLPDVTALQAYIAPETWIADLSPAEPFPQQRYFDLVLDGRRFKLWRWREAER